MKILKFPHPFLLKPTVLVNVFGVELSVLLDSMWEIMLANNGLGLSANQLGLPFKMFVMKGPSGRLNIINPVILKQSLKQADLKEGCLSAPGEFVIVPSRVDWIQMRYTDEAGQSKVITLKEIHAVCAQHELEHLQGETFMTNKSIPKNIRRKLSKKWGLK